MEINFKTNIKSFLDELKVFKPVSTNTPACFNRDADIKAVIFDIYGTLLISSSGDIDQASLQTENIKTALLASDFCLNESIDELVVLEFFLEQLKVVVKKHQSELVVKGHLHPDVDIIAVWDEIMADALDRGYIIGTGGSVVDFVMVFELLSNRVYPMPGMEDVLLYCREKNIPMGIVSNAQFYTPIIMNYFLNGSVSSAEFIDGFQDDLCVFSYKELRAKPDHSIFELFIPVLKSKYHIEAHEAVFVGNDMLKDVYTANKAGLKTVLFAGDERSLRLRPDDVRTANLKPDYVITELMQLTEIVG